jgi:hypothetical protein
VYNELSPRKKIDLVVNQLKMDRYPHEPQMREIADFLLPYRLRLNLTDHNRGDRKNTRIYDSTALFAVDTLESGLMTMACDPSSKWFELTTKDPDRAEFGPNKMWLEEVTDLALGVMDGANSYVTMPTVIGNMAGFGTSVMSIEENFQTVIHTRALPTGSFWIAQDEWGTVDTLYREFRMTVRQLYLKFGHNGDFSSHVQNLIDTGKWEEWVDIGHIVYPNGEYVEGKPSRKNKRFKSCWFEIGTYSKAASAGPEDKFLLEAGFDSFPYLCGRWELTEGDVYAVDCPGMKSLGDNKGLQILQKRGAQYIEKGVMPHWLAPIGLKGTLDHGFLPNETSYVQEREEGKSVRPAHIVDPGWLSPLGEREEEVRERIYTAFSTRLFRMFDLSPEREMTATEVMERKRELLGQFPKMYANFQRGVLRPKIDRTLEVMFRQGMIPPAPPDLQGHELDYKYNGQLAQAQKMTGVNPIERVLATFIPMTKDKPDIWDKMNLDQMIDEIASRLGVPASCIRSDEAVEAIRAERQKAMAAQQQMAMIEQASKTVKNLGQTPMGEESVLGAMGAA